MKKIYTLIFLFIGCYSFSQNNVGIGIPTPDASAILDLTSTSQGFLVPRMTAVQRLAIATPATGLVVYDKDTACAFFYNGTTWKNLCVSNSGGHIDSVYYNANGSLTIVDGSAGIKTTIQDAWLTNGNQGTVSTANFIGTTDAQDLVMKSNNAEVARITTNGAMGINQPAPAASAVLDVASTTKGVLVPRTQVALVTAPILGLLIFDTDSNCFCYYAGSSWKNLCGSGNAWQLLGNAGTNAAVNFAGTTDAQDFVLKSNGTEVIRATTVGAVGINQPTPNTNAILDIQSTAKGVLFPSLTTAQRDAIVAPINGLTIYNNTLNVHQFWNGTCWVNVGQTVCSFDYAIAESHNSDCLLRTNFTSVFDTLTISLVGGTPAPVILSASGVPAGVLVNFSNSYVTPTATSIVSFTALPSAAVGNFVITILATSGSNIQTLTYTLTVYDYNLSVSPILDSVNEIGIAPNHLTATTTITIGNPGACGQTGTNALLSVNGLPNGVSASFGNSNLPVPGTTSLTFTSSSCAVPGTYVVQVVAQIGILSTTTTYTLEVLPSVINFTTSANNVNLFQLAGTPACPITLTVNIAAGVAIGSANTGQAALVTGAFPGGTLLTINNNGRITGAGGNGGDDVGHNGTTCPNKDGQAGGNALDLGVGGVVINNNGVIGGGGGGGGAGAELGAGNPCTAFRTSPGGGGGAGSVVGQGGANTGCGPGANGGANNGGAGGNGNACTVNCTIVFFSFGPYNPGNGGAGGNLGQPGTGGSGSQGFVDFGVCGSGNGGAAGCGLKLNGNTYTFNGAAVLGPICP